MSLDVSVVVPACGAAAPEIGRCIQSVLGQSLGMGRMEVIVIDDGSTTGEELERLAREHPSIQVLHEHHSTGTSHCRNRGLELARGRCVFFLDAECSLGTEALERLVRVADEQSSDVVLGKYASLTGASVPRSMFDRNQPRTDVFASRAYWSLSALKLFRRELLERLELRFPLDMELGADQPFVARAYLEASAISVLADYDYVYLAKNRAAGHGGRRVTDLPARIEVARRPMTIVGEHVEPGPKRDLLMLRHFEIEFMRSILPAFAAEPAADIRRSSFDALRALVTAWYNDEIAAHLPPKGRVALQLIRRDHCDELREFLQQTASLTSWEPVVDGDRVFAKYPYFRDPNVAVSDSCYEVTSKVSCNYNLDAIAWRGAVLHLAGWAYLDVLPSENVELSLVLRERRTAAEYVQAVNPGARTKLTSKVWGRRVEHLAAGFSVDLDPAAIGRVSPQVCGRWDAFLRLTSNGFTRERRIGKQRSPKIILDTARRRFDDGSTAGKRARIQLTKKHDNLTLEIDDAVGLAEPATPVVAQEDSDNPKTPRPPRAVARGSAGTTATGHHGPSIATLNPDIVVVCGEKLNTNHLAIWKPYLSRLPFGVCLCTKATGAAQVDCGFPLFVEGEGYGIDQIGRIPNLKLLLYISNWPNNWRYFYQYPRASNVNNSVRHVFLGHGDSDKESSHSRVAKIYDYILVADEAAVDRYHRNGVEIPMESFLMVGAPTLPGISVRTKLGPLQNILYAPTFEAKRADANFSSLERLHPVIVSQIAAKRFRFQFRPHPTTGARLSEFRAYADAIKNALPKSSKDKVIQFNDSDAIISDVSGVMSEYLFTGKPIIVPLAPRDTLAREALDQSEMRDVVYLWNYETTDLESLVSSIAADPLFEKRSQFRSKKFLGANSFDDSYATFCRVLTNVMPSAPKKEKRAAAEQQPATPSAAAGSKPAPTGPTKARIQVQGPKPLEGEGVRSPYANLPPARFWRTGVVEQDLLTTEILYRKKFDITPTTRIATAGSCFAQHLSARMRDTGFCILDVEPPPDADMSADLAKQFGYGLYSARYGNIYHMRQLLQLGREAFGLFEPTDYIWARGGRFFDALRPGVEPAGLGSTEEVAAHRKQHLANVAKLFTSMDLMILTLGLTEAWTHRATGTVFPTAPGTIAGTYDEDEFEFRNFSFNEIYGDFVEFRTLVQSRNPELKFLLTVSPVPLTATATQDHVLVATTYSKSVLRAVAGELQATFPDVDYFPSYEIIAAPWSRGRFYQSNLRSIEPAGVDNVMRVFFLEHRVAAAQRAEAPGNSALPGAPDDEEEGLICEEALLAEFAEKC